MSLEQRLTLIRKLPPKSGNTVGLYRCSCGVEKAFFRSNVNRGNSRSCGCLNNEVATERLKGLPNFGEGTPTHRMSKSPEYTIWCAMRNRCEREANDNYKWYGGRGISVCERWGKFENFYADMGSRPDGYTIERLDNDKGYGPDNCVWATWDQQSKNKRPIGSCS